jgi:hypothetical protein
MSNVLWGLTSSGKTQTSLLRDDKLGKEFETIVDSINEFARIYMHTRVAEVALQLVRREESVTRRVR